MSIIDSRWSAIPFYTWHLLCACAIELRAEARRPAVQRAFTIIATAATVGFFVTVFWMALIGAMGGEL